MRQPDDPGPDADPFFDDDGFGFRALWVLSVFGILVLACLYMIFVPRG